MPGSSALQQDKLHIKRPTGPKSSGHEVDFGAFTLEGSNYTSQISKFNKQEGREGEEASILEVAFSEIALLFIKPGLTPPARIVKNGEDVVGVASENFNVQIKKLVDQGIKCYSFNPTDWTYETIPEAISEPMLQERIKTSRDTLLNSERLGKEEEISDEALKGMIHLSQTKKAVNFLDKMPKSFFNELMAKHNKGEVVVDMESLASILAASYVLEEDDLHKGNIGFYVTDTVGKDGNTIKKFDFYKIDHDLMFSQSIMSQKDMRLANIFYNKNSFKISARDLDGFPDLKDSGNHYWPTKERLFVAGDKAYTDQTEREAFANLKSDHAFVDAKWKYFLKSAVIPVALIEKSLTAHLDKDKEIDKVNMVKNSIYTRIGELKNKLLESEQFRQYITTTKGQEAFKEIREEIEAYIMNTDMEDAERNLLMAELDDNFKLLVYCANDTQKVSPLLQSIMLGSYSFSSEIKPTEHDVHVALDQVKHQTINDPVGSRSFASACIALDVIQKSDFAHGFSEKVTELKQIKATYLTPANIKSLKDFEVAADKIRASNLPLKQQKNEIIAVLKEANLPLKDLQDLKIELQKNEPDSPSLKFINQLRSNLWFVKKILGTYGQTTTSSMMIDEVDAKIAKQQSILNSHSFKDKHSSIIDTIEREQKIEINPNVNVEESYSLKSN